MDRTIWDEIFIKLLPLSSCLEPSDVRGYKPKITLELIRAHFTNMGDVPVRRGKAGNAEVR